MHPKPEAQWRKPNSLSQSQFPPPSPLHALKTSIFRLYPLLLILTPLLLEHGEKRRQHSKLAEMMQTAKETQKSASGQLSLRTSLQCDTNCPCQRQLTMNPPKRQHSHLFLEERIGWSRQSSRLRCVLGFSNQALIDTVSIIESLSDIPKRSPTLPFPPFNTIDKQRRPLARASSPRTRRHTSSSHRPTALPSPLRRAFAWHERPLVPGKAGITGKLRF